MKSSSTGVFQDAGWVTSDGGAASLMLIADRPAGVGGAAVGDGAVPAGMEAAKTALGQLGGEATAPLTIAFMGPEEDILKGITQVAPRRAGGRRLSIRPLSLRQVPAELETRSDTWLGSDISRPASRAAPWPEFPPTPN